LHGLPFEGTYTGLPLEGWHTGLPFEGRHTGLKMGTESIENPHPESKTPQHF